MTRVKRLYLLNLWMVVVDTGPDIRYWSEVLCHTVQTHISDLKVKVMDLEEIYVSFFRFKFLLKAKQDSG